ncbi:DUF6299 family protein [Amycolatopsis sp. PS_44_ISF1]|uniref:DUF6299 family protein n=1 Tax=Amycolatopsis sp. PS_44_ISF1 TaxID=2974917 RepID=UPI0028DDB661|nr:DUF6299 family protein [Amycolatopsis sp. PS_44_ISF1]MDT8912986.1 DUF6299 family protein [Amycolatopsis sp. PS_44_ISF1]
MSKRLATLATILATTGLLAAPPALADTSTITIDASGPLTVASAKVSGTYRCDRPVTPQTVFVSTSLGQNGISRTIGHGTFANCDGQPHSYTASGTFTEPPFVSGPVKATSLLMSLAATGLPLPNFLATATRDLSWQQ